MPEPTPSQTIGPFFHDALTDERYASFTNRLVPKGTPGEIVIEGRVLDGAGEEVPDAMIEILHADKDGTYPQDATGEFTGFGRSDTRDGGFRFFTVKPGAPEGEAPHVNVSIFARGLLKRIVTRIYFPDEDNSEDTVLVELAGDKARTLVAEDLGGGVYRFDVRLQSDGQTVFFDV